MINVNKEDFEEKKGDVENKEERKFSDFEQKMISKGWKPDGEKSAEEWFDTGFEIKNKHIQDLTSTVEYLKKKAERDEKEAYNRALEELKREKRAAVAASDYERLEAIEKKQANLDHETKEAINDFMSRHSAWFNGLDYKSLKMKEVFDRKDRELTGLNLPIKKHIAVVEEYLKGEFPEYFGAEKMASAVEGGQSHTMKKSKSELGFNDLSEEQKSIAKMLEKKGVMTKDKYIQELIKNGELK